MLKKISIMLLTAVALMPTELWAQADLASQRLGRAYWHVFIAYAIAWALVLAWMFVILRRLARVEQKLDQSPSE
jgi:CcmD family protein